MMGLDFLSSENLIAWATTLGYIGVLAIVFIETGCFFGFFLPGDSLLFAAGLLAHQDVFNLWILVPALAVVATVGYMLGYWFGDKLGHWLMKREDSLWFKRAYITRTREFYDKYGRRALLFGRLVPIVRTFVPIVAGMAEMRYRDFIVFNILGSLIWAVGVTLSGYYLGVLIPGLVDYILWIALAVILVSVLPGAWHWLRHRQRRC